MKQKLLILFTLTFFLIFPQSLFAAGFQLKTVGSLDVEGVTYTQLWYSSGNVTFTGTALENAQVTATIDGTSETVTADASGNWSYTTSLADGDHQVSFTSNESTLAFTLTIGAVPEDVGSLPAAETPTVGLISPTIILLFAGILIIASVVFFSKKNLPKI